MAESPRSPEQPHDGKPSSKRRIETQIHRRKKAKAVPPLEAEWDIQSGAQGTGLRTPADKMSRRSK